MSDNEPFNMCCLVCDKALVSSFTGETSPKYAPTQALVCVAEGNFGSALFDPLPDERQYLEFYVCDDCAKRRARVIWRVRTPYAPPNNTYERFDPGK